MESVPLTADLPTARKNRLLKILGVGFGLAMVIGGMIGVGILRTLGAVAANLRSVWLIIAIWIFGGIYALIGANTFAELATMLPEDGGGYVYIRRSFGNFFGFAGGMTDFIYIGLRVGDFAVKITSFAKLAAFSVLIAACFLFGGNAAPVAPPADNTSFANPLMAFAAVALSLQLVMETYSGWNSPVYFAEENTDPAGDSALAFLGRTNRDCDLRSGQCGFALRLTARGHRSIKTPRC